MSPGLTAAQIVHAAGESSTGNLPPETYAVALQASIEQLKSLHKRLDADGVSHVVVCENDPPYRGEVMAIGAKPGLRSKLRRYFSNFPLIK